MNCQANYFAHSRTPASRFALDIQPGIFADIAKHRLWTWSAGHGPYPLYERMFGPYASRYTTASGVLAIPGHKEKEAEASYSGQLIP